MQQRSVPHPLIYFDNAVIRIGFEAPHYTYMETEFDKFINATFEPPTNLTTHGPIYLAKENNVQSEQTFDIVIQVIDSVPSGESINPATIGDDYSIGGRRTSVVIQFPPTMQRVIFPIRIVFDVSPEGTEAFRASSSYAYSAQSNGMQFNLSGYFTPINLSAETFVIIEDDDCKGRYGIHYCE